MTQKESESLAVAILGFTKILNEQKYSDTALENRASLYFVKGSLTPLAQATERSIQLIDNRLDQLGREERNVQRISKRVFDLLKAQAGTRFSVGEICQLLKEPDRNKVKYALAALSTTVDAVKQTTKNGVLVYWFPEQR
jgi:hypothetical protein